MRLCPVYLQVVRRSQGSCELFATGAGAVANPRASRAVAGPRGGDPRVVQSTLWPPNPRKMRASRRRRAEYFVKPQDEMVA
jgi:hypothetical protein